MKPPKRGLLACLLSFSLILASIPPVCFSQGAAMGASSGGRFQPAGKIAASGAELYRQLLSFPEFAKAPSGSDAVFSIADILLEAVPLLRQGPASVQKEGNRVLIVPAQGEALSFEINPGLKRMDVPEAAVQLAGEIQKAAELDQKEGAAFHVDRVLSRFYDSQIFDGDWIRLAEHIQKPLGHLSSPVSIKNWQEETAGILRQSPVTPLETALARGYAKAHKLDEAQSDRIERLFFLSKDGFSKQDLNARFSQVVSIEGDVYALSNWGIFLWKGGQWIQERFDQDPEDVYQILKAEGKLYAAADGGIYVKEGNVWKRELRTWATQLSEIDGKLYAATRWGLYVRESGFWRPAFGSPTEYVSCFAKSDGKFYVGAYGGLYVERERGLLRFILGLFSSHWGAWKKQLKAGVLDFAQSEGRLYARTRDGLYVKEKNAWRVEINKNVYDLVEIDGKLYAATHQGLYVNEGNGWVGEGPGGWVSQIIEIDGQLYTVGEGGIYVKRNGKWNLVFSHSDLNDRFARSVQKIGYIDGIIYLLADVYLWTGSLIGLPESWRDNILRHIASLIDRDLKDIEKNQSVSASAEPFKTDGEGNILGEDGRTIFSGFKHGASVLLAMLGAGALEGLSRLALSLGNLNLGFAEPAEPANDKPDASEKDVWTRLENWIQKESGINFQPGRIEDWKTETAGILRNHPAMELPKALAGAFAKAHKLPSEKEREIEKLLFFGKTGLEFSMEHYRWMFPLARLDGRLFAPTVEWLYEYKNGRWVCGYNARGVHQMIQFEGKIYAASLHGLYVNENDYWRQDLDGGTNIQAVNHLVVVDGKLYAASDWGLYIKQGDKWEAVKGWENKPVYYFGKWKGRFCVGAENGLYIQEGEKWRRIFFSRMASYFAEFEGRLHVVAGDFWGRYPDQEIYVLEGEIPPEGFWSRVLLFFFPERNPWKPLTPHGREKHPFGRVYQLSYFDGKLYTATDNGLYAREGDRMVNELPKVEDVYHIAHIGGRSFVSTRQGIFRKTGERWRTIVAHEAAFLQEMDGVLYTGNNRGLYRWDPGPLGDHEDLILKDLAPRIDQAAKSSEELHSDFVIKSDDQGNILGEDGRTIFSGFKHGANVLLAMLGAGALEGLSRLALSLGNLNLGFGKPVEKTGRPEFPRKDVWPILERWMQESLDLRLQPGRSQEWKKETAEVLRSRPSLSLEKALAEGLARVQSVDSKKSREIESLLDGKAAALPKDPRWTLVERIFELDGKLTITTNNGIYRKEGEKWESAFKDLAYKPWMDEFENDKMKRVPQFVSQIARINGKLYGATEEGLFVQEGRDWKPILRDVTHGMVGTVYQVAEIGGTLYAAARKGLFSFKKGRWGENELPDAGEIYQLARFQGTLYAATASGLFAFKDKKWKKEKINNSGWFHSMAEIDGNLYASAQRGLYLKQGKGWKLLLEEAGAVHQLLKLGGRLYAAAGKGLYVQENGKWRQVLSGMGEVGRLAYWDHAIYLTAGGLEGNLGIWRWVPPSGELPINWRSRALKDIGREIEQAQKAREKKNPGSGPLSSDQKGNIIGEDGRTIFGG